LTPFRPSESPIRIRAERVGAHTPGSVNKTFSGARIPSGSQMDHAMTKVNTKKAGMGFFLSQFESEVNMFSPF
jgi:hypothetical protein